jgi:2-methylisocitrate lyase-like PEP mutase family enzyme
MIVTANVHSEGQPRSSAARLRELLAQEGKTIACPGVYDGLTARIVLNEGFDAFYMTGAGTAMSRLGMPDLGLTNLNDMVENASMIASLDRTTPLIADADAGFGGPLMVARTVRAYMAAGVAAMHLEDQVVTKRCGHLANKELVDESVYLSRIRAAVLAREELRSTVGTDIVLIARTDSLQRLGYDVAISRLKQAVEAGADVAFLEGMETVEQCQQVCIDLAPTPVLLNMVAGGVTPDLSLDEANNLGFKIVIFPLVALGPVVEEVSRHVKQFKITKRNAVSDIQKSGGVSAMFEVCGMTECIGFDVKAGGTSFNSGL